MKASAASLAELATQAEVLPLELGVPTLPP